jgi:hypothetical protein
MSIFVDYNNIICISGKLQYIVINGLILLGQSRHHFHKMVLT